jgi:HEPN domain-containing protein
MPPEQRDSADPKDWLRRARSNLALARQGTLLGDEVLYEDLCFDAQQAAEKAIKALLIHRGAAYPKTHDIAHLLTLVQRSGLEVPEEIRQSSRLTRYAGISRYGGLPEALAEEDYARIVRLAERVYRWAESLIV